MDDFAIRLATPDDLGALHKVFVRAYAPTRARLPDLPDVTGGLADDIRDRTVLIAVRNGAIAGGVVLDLSGATALLANLAVDPDHGGHGVGRRLIAASESCARQAGAAELHLNTHSGMHRTLALYRRLGWAETGRDGNRVRLSKTL